MTYPATSSYGIPQGDVILRSALVYGLQELRVYPNLVDDALCWLVKDDLTAEAYGQSEVDAARRWFLATNVHVTLARQFSQAKFPCLVVTLGGSDEEADTLSDIAPEVAEATPTKVRSPITLPFSPTSYDRLTGKLVVPQAVVDQVVLVPRQILLTRAGDEVPILSVSGVDTCYVQPGLAWDLAGCVVMGAPPTHLTQLKCARFSEQYIVGIHTTGESYQNCLWLHSLTEFVLLRARQHLLQARGLDCSQIRSSPLAPGQEVQGSPEMIHSRSITVSGKVHKYWTQDVVERVAGMNFGMTLGTGGGGAETIEADDGSVVADVVLG